MTDAEKIEQQVTEVSTQRKEKHLRNRPFLMVSIAGRPKQGINTAVKGWSDHPSNWESFEKPIVTDRVNSKHLLDYSIIIDVINSKAVKNSFSANSTDEDVVNHYLNRYRDIVTEAMDIWLNDLAKKVAKDMANQA